MHQLKLTLTGQSKQAASLIGDPSILLSHVAIGDAGGAGYAPTGDEQALVSERWRGPLSGGIVEGSPGRLRLQAYIPASVGGFTIREIGLFDAAGDLIAIGVLDWPKAAISDASAEDLRIVINLRVSNPESFTLQVDPTVSPVTLAQMQDAAGTAKSEAIQAAGQAAAQALSNERLAIDQAISQAVTGALSSGAQGIATAKSEAIQAATQQVSALADQLAVQLAAASARAAAGAASAWADVPSDFGAGRIRAVCAGRITPQSPPTFLIAGDAGKIQQNTYLNLLTVADSTFGTSNINGMAMGAGVIVAVGHGGKIATSPNGWTWTARTSGTTADLFEVIHTPHGFFAHGGGLLLHSLDGITWTNKNPTGQDIRCIAYDSGMLAVCAQSKITYSADGGTSWGDAAVFPDYGLSAIAYGYGLTVGVDSMGYIWVSSDNGEDWTFPWVETMESASLVTVRFDGQVFVAVSDSGRVLVSPDGFEWGTAAVTGSVQGSTLNSLAPTPLGWMLGGENGTLQRTMRKF